jgi:hypothetical protein
VIVQVALGIKCVVFARKRFLGIPLLNLKQEDYICFKKGMNIIKLKKHLTTEGLKTLKELNSEMNSNRLK